MCDRQLENRLDRRYAVETPKWDRDWFHALCTVFPSASATRKFNSWFVQKELRAKRSLHKSEKVLPHPSLRKRLEQKNAAS